MPMSLNSASRPNVRASSGMIGTMCLPMPLCRSKTLISRTKAIVVEASVLEPLKNSAKQSSLGTSSFDESALTLRAGKKPPNVLRRSSKYFVSGLSAGGR